MQTLIISAPLPTGLKDKLKSFHQDVISTIVSSAQKVAKYGREISLLCATPSIGQSITDMLENKAFSYTENTIIANSRKRFKRFRIFILC